MRTSAVTGDELCAISASPYQALILLDNCLFVQTNKLPPFNQRFRADWTKMAHNAPIRRNAMPTQPTGFASVKLPTALVDQAREAAQPLRRSVAGQVEYWATLGRIVEHSGLTAQEAQTAIARYEAAARRARSNPKETAKQATTQADALLAQFMGVEDDASLAQRVREVVAGNQSKAVKPRKAAA
jgi:hypothetical protein